MPILNFSYPSVIGISGAARAGKDTLCRGLIRCLEKENKKAIRRSIAGDQVKKDVHDLVMSKLGLDSFTENNDDKELIRPLLVEYGKLMRSTTKGRYFIDKFEEVEDTINILPDIRYAEYPKDEVHWLKNEKNGVLIFVEREGVSDVNDTERVNNKIIRELADYKFRWADLNDKTEEGRDKIDQYAKNILSFIFIQAACRNQSTTSAMDMKLP